MIRDQILDSIADLRRDNVATAPGFNDPLATNELNQHHYASGERRLLCGLNHYLHHSHATISSDHDQIASQLLDYLRIRNAFHQALVQDRGVDGLMRFIETFGRRRFFGSRKVRTYTTCVDNSNPERSARRERRGRRQRKRYRAKQSHLERFRMRAALDAQLIHAFNSQTA